MRKRLALVLLLWSVLPYAFLLLFIIFGMQNEPITEPNVDDIVMSQQEEFPTQQEEFPTQQEQILPQLKAQDFDNAGSANTSIDADVEYPFQYNPALYSDAELISKAESLEFRIGPCPEGYDPFAKPNIIINSDDYIDIAEEYVRLYNEDRWGGNPTTKYNGLSITVPNGDLRIDDVSTGVRTNRRIFYDIVKELYDRGSWDGEPAILGSHTIALKKSDRGYLLVDGYIICSQVSFDLPTSFSYEGVCKIRYVADDGTYVTYEYGTVIKYVRGKVDGNPAWVLKP